MRAESLSRPNALHTAEGVCPKPVYCSFYRRELETLYQVSQLLGQSLNLGETSQEVLKLLHEEGRLHYGMICLVDEASGDLKITDIHQDHSIYTKNVRYQPGEGIVGSILSEQKLILVPKISEEPRFLDQLGIYDPNRPFIGAPIFSGDGQAIGVLAAQPNNADKFFEDNAKLVQMIASLIGKVLQLSDAVQAEQNELRAERDSLRRRVKRQHGFENIVGETEAMRMVFDQVRLVAKWNTTVLIRGESGTGKELIANAIHYNSPRAHEPFLKLNCAALPDNLLESELFGHEKGAFTGATSMRKGRFEEADGGTLFLDEIGEITPAFQSKLLRVLQEGEFERVGGNKTIKVDVRIIAATNKDLETSIESGDFREDLYYRLNVMAINMPSLQERMDDIPDLARFLIGKIGDQQGRQLTLKDSAIRLLMRHTWPGNVRELENCLERASVMSPNGIIDRETVSLTGLPEKTLVGVPSQPLPPILKPVESAAVSPAKAWQDEELDERERVIAALEEAGWVQAKAARLLDMTPRQIAYRIKILGIAVRKI